LPILSINVVCANVASSKCRSTLFPSVRLPCVLPYTQILVRTETMPRATNAPAYSVPTKKKNCNKTSPGDERIGQPDSLHLHRYPVQIHPSGHAPPGKENLVQSEGFPYECSKQVKTQSWNTVVSF